MNNFKIYNDDCLNVLKTMEDNSIDSCVTDPPYGLSFMGKLWDYDVPQKEIWEQVFRVLKPGAYLLAFFGSRTYHRGVVQIEDAGFEIRDQIMWLYGSGFPKSLNVGKAIDKDAGAKRTNPIGPKINTYDGAKRNPENHGNPADQSNVGKWGLKKTPHGIMEFEPATDEAKKWEGWGTALKPAHEPIVVARKPIHQSVAKNVLEYGTGALNIDGCRVGEENGRWPANVIHDGSDEVVSKFPDAKGGTTNGNAPTGVSGNITPMRRGNLITRNDSGSAARFFYCAKASKADREQGNNHPTVKPTELMKYLCRLVTPPNGIILDPFMGSGSTGKAALQEGFNFIGIEMNKEYYEIAEKRIEQNVTLKNFMQ